MTLPRRLPRELPRELPRRLPRRNICCTLPRVWLLLLAFVSERIKVSSLQPFVRPSKQQKHQVTNFRTDGGALGGATDWFSAVTGHRRRISYLASTRSNDPEKSGESSIQGLPQSGPADRNYLISPEQLEALKDSVDIVALVESYELPSFSRKGDQQSATAICPFHDDHSPSMSIDNNRKMFKCFACGEGGDAFKFVRSYSALSSAEPMTFYESVRHVAKHFGDPSLNIGTGGGGGGGPRESEEQRRTRLAKRQRLLLCNAAAGAFYGKALVMLPTAGTARSHLRSRGLSPATIRIFALGYAPDAYYQASTQKKWGEGSLVNHLRDAGFTATEIIEAGLAKPTKRASWKDIVEVDGSTNEDVDDFETLMDRFRGRLMVPIFDDTGKNVIAFGGRILPTIGNVTTDFKPPKYLNSPESPVFSKKLELFGLHSAKGAIDESKSEAQTKGQHMGGSIVIVEGYMDAIALWEAGFHQVAASMGTAMSQEQLDKAAKAAGNLGGRIILCLDNDDAGLTAVERLCSSQFLAKTCKTHVVEVMVASLPDGIKDPGEYFESKVGDIKDFRRDVLGSASEWSQWYIQRILSRYDVTAVQGGPGSFADVCERVSDFLATFSNSIDRTKRSFEVSRILSGIILADSNSSSNALQIQLESDLLGLVSRKAAVKETFERRVEGVDGYGTRNKTATMSRMLEGGVSESALETSKLSRNATKSNLGDDNTKSNRPSSSRAFTAKSSFQEGGRTRMKRRGQAPEREPMTKHFAGVAISKASDAAWLGVSADKSRRKLHALTFGAQKDDQKRWPDLVFFNSNDFHGDQYLTQEASNAGYVKGEVKRDAAMLEKGIGIFLTEDQDKKAILAEERLLSLLVQHLPARSAMSAAVSTSDATGATLGIDWSTEERAWLFNFLVLRGDEISEEIGDGEDPDILWTFLSERGDAPRGAFGTNPLQEQHLDALVEPMDIADSSASPMDSEEIRLNAVDATTVPVNEDETVSTQTPPSPKDTDNWSANHDSSMFDQSEIPRNDDMVPEPSSMPLDVIDADTVLDAKLESQDPSDMVPKNDHPVEELKGKLDRFFALDEDIFATTYDESVTRSFRAELEVQEALAYLLRSSAARKLSNVNSNWLLSSRLLDARLGVEDAVSDVMSGVAELDSMNVGDLQLYCQSLITRLKQLYDTVYELDASAKRISTRLMEYSQGDNTEGRISIAKQEQVCSEIEQFVSDLPESYVPKEVDNLMDPMYVLSLYEQPGEEGDNKNGGPRKSAPSAPMQQESYNPAVEEAKFEDDMITMDEFWGGMDDDSYSWSMPDVTDTSGSAFPTDSDESGIFDAHDEMREEEMLEEELARMDDEWGDWENDMTANAMLVSSNSNDGTAQEELDHESEMVQTKEMQKTAEMFTLEQPFEEDDDGKELQDPDWKPVTEVFTLDQPFVEDNEEIDDSEWE